VRERLLDAAETLFYRDGVGRTAVDAVLAEAGVSPATLYAHFGGKDQLVAAYLVRRLQRWRTVWDTAIDEQSSAEGRLLAVFDALHRFRADQPAARGCAFIATAAELPGHPALHVVAADTAHLRARLHALAADLDVPQPDELAEQVLLAYDGVLSAFLRTGPGDPITRGRQLAAAAITTAREAVPS
jgi:AcrR family transcriptional regulator